MTGRHTSRNSHADSGFALPLAMFTIAVVAMILTVSSRETRSAGQMMAEISQRRESEIAAYSVEQVMIYTIATSPVDRAGLHAGAANMSLGVSLGDSVDFSGELGVQPLDSSPCIIAYSNHQFVVELQDAAGLINLNAAPYDLLKRTFENIGVSQSQAGPFAERLLDYIEYKGASNVRRLNGATAADYERAGLPPPTNSPLRSVSEAQSILGFAESTILWGPGGLFDVSTTVGEAYVNPNTASARVLQAAYGLTREGAERVVSGRALAPVTSPETLESLAGEPILARDDFSFNSEPGRNIILRVRDRSLDISWYSTLVISPEGEIAPYDLLERRVVGDADSHVGADARDWPFCPTAAPLDP